MPYTIMHDRSTDNITTGMKRKWGKDAIATPPKRARKDHIKTSVAPVVDLTGNDEKDAAYTAAPPKKGGKGSKDKAPKTSAEKRLSRFRAKAPQKFNDYYYRATTQRMIVLDRQRGAAVGCPHGDSDCPSETMDIAGSTGNVYRVTITHQPTCTCPNFVKGNPQCKHIIYGLVKVLKAPAELQYQLAFLTSELHEIFDKAGPLPAETVHEADKDGKRHAVEGDCAICCEDLNPDAEEIVWCKAACGNNLHKSCFDQWAATKRGGQVTCPYCRTPWQQDGGDLKGLKKGKVGADGYVNVGAELGLSGTRDYSTYHPFWVRQQVSQGLLTDYDEGWS
ncbi:RING finger domain-containing protein [Myriangium duriaei CBS 260.36]|uniref:RING finger domain-containing protein n=1 Tax=Myriangium duriaei CBS 260.36 TaxID=1168546 RepID=A0A9P4JB13_9PEZI|nr:RING finger domain-containing protein [Myriangium duriaei CBS 260.36]